MVFPPWLKAPQYNGTIRIPRGTWLLAKPQGMFEWMRTEVLDDVLVTNPLQFKTSNSNECYMFTKDGVEVMVFTTHCKRVRKKKQPKEKPVVPEEAISIADSCPIRITDTLRFYTKGDFTAYIKDILRNTDGVVSNPDHMFALEYLTMFHPKYEEKFGDGVLDFKVDGSDVFLHSRCFWALRKDAQWVSFSYKTCLGGLRFLKNKAVAD